MNLPLLMLDEDNFGGGCGKKLPIEGGHPKQIREKEEVTKNIPCFNSQKSCYVECT